ncbi:MAG: hypothetical protein Q9191_004161 [Dirinaria sp. TL-2023a]
MSANLSENAMGLRLLYDPSAESVDQSKSQIVEYSATIMPLRPLALLTRPALLLFMALEQSPITLGANALGLAKGKALNQNM